MARNRKSKDADDESFDSKRKPKNRLRSLNVKCQYQKHFQADGLNKYFLK